MTLVPLIETENAEKRIRVDTRPVGVFLEPARDKFSIDPGVVHLLKIVGKNDFSVVPVHLFSGVANRSFEMRRSIRFGSMEERLSRRTALV